MNEIKTMLDSVVGTKKDWKEDFLENSKSDWIFDFDQTVGDAAIDDLLTFLLSPITFEDGYISL